MTSGTQPNSELGAKCRQAAKDFRDTLHELPVYGWLSQVAHHKRVISIATLPVALMLYNVLAWVGMSQEQKAYVASAVTSTGSTIYKAVDGLACRIDPRCVVPKPRSLETGPN